MLLPECEDKVDPDRIQLPGTRAHNLNTLEEFELDYSQVWERRFVVLSRNNSISPGSLTPTQERVELRVHRGVWHQPLQLPRYQNKSSSAFETSFSGENIRNYF